MARASSVPGLWTLDFRLLWGACLSLGFAVISPSWPQSVLCVLGLDLRFLFAIPRLGLQFVH